MKNFRTVGWQPKVGNLHIKQYIIFVHIQVADNTYIRLENKPAPAPPSSLAASLFAVEDWVEPIKFDNLKIKYQVVHVILVKL